MLKNNLFLKIISLLLAMFLWVYVMAEVDPATTDMVRDIPVRLQHVDELEKKGLAVRSTKNMKVSLSLTGKRTAVVKLQKSKIRLTVDVGACQEGKNTLPVRIGLPEGISLAQDEPPEVKVNIEKRVTAYQPMEVDFQGTSAPGTQPGRISTKPRGLEIKGGQSAVAQVKQLQVKVDATKVKEEESIFYLPPVPLDQEGNLVEGVELSAKKVEVRTTLCQLKTVPLKIKTTGTLPPNLRKTLRNAPKEITIKGSKGTLEHIEKITTTGYNLKRAKANTTSVVTPILPQGVELADRFAHLKIQIQFEKV